MYFTYLSEYVIKIRENPLHWNMLQPGLQPNVDNHHLLLRLVQWGVKCCLMAPATVFVEGWRMGRLIPVTPGIQINYLLSKTSGPMPHHLACNAFLWSAVSYMHMKRYQRNDKSADKFKPILLQQLFVFSKMLQKYLYVSGKSKLNILPSQFNYLLHFRESKMIARILPVQQNWKKLMKLTCLGEIQF